MYLNLVDDDYDNYDNFRFMYIYANNYKMYLYYLFIISIKN